MKDYQSILFPYAYNILGSAEDARDAVQDVLYKYLSGQQKEVDNEKAYLIKAVINQSINIKDKKKKIRYGDEWLPEPIATEETDKAIRLNDIASYSLLILLEKLNPKERAVFILKEGFDYAHEEIAEVLSATAENSRQLLSRARRKLDADKQISRLEKPQQLLLQQFLQAVRDKDIHALEHLLTEDIQYSADGGGVIKVVAKHCSGIKEVIDLIILVYTRFLATATIVPTIINHQPAFLYYRKEELCLCQIFGFSADGKITQINNVLDPQKLKGLKPTPGPGT
ncbi:MAG TPA: sigma-70 family RNA polymerase sigma factor [Puia sp.]|nr:sigma-70 family RNA polymerase sigma factor [Puia sp.]